jgi:hypothetical protein
MFDLFATIPRVLFAGFQSRRQLTLENLVLRHQLTVLRRSVPRAKLQNPDRFLWVLLCRARHYGQYGQDTTTTATVYFKLETGWTHCYRVQQTTRIAR